jgi:hypothetical protein
VDVELGWGFDSRWRHWNFHCLNPSSRTMAMGSNESVREMSTGIFHVGKGGRFVGSGCSKDGNASILTVRQPKHNNSSCGGKAIL